MKSLLNLLERFSKSLNKDQLTKEIVIKVVRDKTRVTLHPEEINLKDGVLEISTTPTAKNELSLKENSIRNELKAQGINFSRVLYK